MRYSIFLFLVLSCCLTHASAQDTEVTPQPTFNKHMVGVNFSNDVTSIINNYTLKPTEHFTAQYGYTAAVLYQYRPVKWFSIESGIEYNSTKWFINEENSNPMGSWDGEGFNPMFPAVIDFGKRVNRWAIPLNLRWYYHKGNKWSFYGLTGVLFAIKASTKSIYEIEEWSNTRNNLKIDGFGAHFGMGLTAGIGAEYRFKPHWVLRMEPRFRIYDIVEPNHQDFYNGDKKVEHYWAAGINLGVYYGFGK